MIKTQIVLYAIVYNKNDMKYRILSDTSTSYKDCLCELKNTISFEEQVSEFFHSYFDLDSSYVKFVSLEPDITNETLNLPVYCLVPYSTSIKKGYLIPVYPYALHISNVRKLLSMV